MHDVLIDLSLDEESNVSSAYTNKYDENVLTTLFLAINEPYIDTLQILLVASTQ